MSIGKLLQMQRQKEAIKSESQPAPPELPAPVVESESSPAELPAPSIKQVAKGLGLNLAGAAKAVAAAKPPTPTTPAEDDLVKPFSLDDLASMEAATIASPDDNPYVADFPDEIEATAPDRELPDDLSAEQQSFVESLDGVYGVLHDAEMFGQSVRLIMLELQQNPEYDKLLSDSDIAVMIRGARRTMGLTKVRKQEKTRKAATNKTARAKAALGDDAMGLLDSLFGG